MTSIRLVSITHPCLGGMVGSKRLDFLSDAEITILSRYEEAGAIAATGTVRRISMPTSGRDRKARFPSLAAALNLLAPDVVHLHADPDTSLALQVARLCGAQTGRGLVLETEMSPTGAGQGWAAALRSRQTLLRTSAVVARNASALASLRRIGFSGLGLIAGRGLEPQSLPDTDDALRLLQIQPGRQPVIGWAGPLDTKSHVSDLLEAIALCEREVIVIIPATGPFYQDVLDRADALEILHRVRFVAPEHSGAVMDERPDLSAFPTMIAAVDALLVSPPSSALDRACSLRSVEFAHIHSIPVIHSGLRDIADLIGDGGWQVPFGDPALLARLFDALTARPRLLAQATAAASNNAQTRHSPEAAAAGLARAITAASIAASGASSRLDSRKTRGSLALAPHRQPGST